MTIEAGKKAPAFSLKDQDGKTVKLSDFEGQWLVLYFYPNDDTPGCTIQACDFTAGIKAFEKLGVKVLGCSPNDAVSHQKFIKKHALKIDLLCDPDHKVIEKYGAWGEKNNYGKVSMGVIRSTALIDPSGKIARYWTKVKAAGHSDAVKQSLVELQG